MQKSFQNYIRTGLVNLLALVTVITFVIGIYGVVLATLTFLVFSTNFLTETPYELWYEYEKEALKAFYESLLYIGASIVLYTVILFIERN